MGQTKSKDAILSRKTHFTKKEIRDLRDKVNHKDNNISAEDFKQTVKKCVPSVSSEDDVFLEQLYAAFAGDNQKRSLDFDEFVDGLSVFMKGNEQEKLALSFKLYDVNHDGYLTKPELERVLLKLSVTFSKEDRTAEIKEMVDQLFKDFDVDNDDKLVTFPVPL
ncbi:EF-hand [Rhizopus microsporus var. microsporus]|uniref:EF-hand n=1 Tax=Rhizopus microsporus var. microsporus TaxID=86635 RepID=A0A1X0R3D6_RHIZD|nr:EF-hand [Rhizopus microsporus var. microsporus]